MSHILEVEGLTTVFDGDGGQMTSADGISFYVDPGEIVCIVGESGCGKSVTSLSLMSLLGRGGKVRAGKALFEGRDLLSMSEKELDKIRGDAVTMIFQDPLTSLNPVFTIGRQITESIRVHMHLDKEAAFKRAVSLLEKVGMPDAASVMKKYPHLLSGGQRQRVMIAMALSCRPRLLIADEPTTALDVTIQAQVLEMIYQLKSENNTSMILITHDLGVVAQNCDYVAIIYAGEVVEYGSLREIYKDTKHPYTEGLFGSIPSLTSDVTRLQAIDGMMPDPTRLPEGCVFCERCKYATPECSKSHPGMVSLGGTHQVRCLRYSHQASDMN